MTKLLAAVVLAAASAIVLGVAANGAQVITPDWPQFSHDASAQNTGITAANVGKLHRQVVLIDGTVDSSPIYLHGAIIGGKAHDTVFVTTSYGKTEAIDARNGKVLWRYTPPTYRSYVGSAQITTMTPLADPDRSAIYAGEPDGHIVKLAVGTGKLIWSKAITRDATHEKLAGSLNYSRGHVLAATDGYIGDAPPYQGHVVTLNPSSGHIDAVWNSLCSDRHALIQPSTCAGSDSAIWGRSAPTVDSATGNIFVATGNGPFDGKTNWGDSVVVLSPDAKRMLKHWTPTNQADLNAQDLDLGSTNPALLANGYFVQSGKDGKLRLLSFSQLAGVNTKTGGELQTVSTPGGGGVRSQPTTWQGSWVFIANDSGTAAWHLVGGRLHAVWSNGTSGTSPVVAGRLLYVQASGGIHVYSPTNGHELAVLPVGTTHWESPIVVDGRVVTAEGDSNSHSASGGLNIFRLP